MSDSLPEVELDFAGADKRPWSVVYWHLREALSTPYECTLVLSLPDTGASPDELLERSATLTVTRATLQRHVRGIVREVEDLGSTATSRYVRVVMVPALSLLAQRLDSRIFQAQPVVDIVRDVLRDADVYQYPEGVVIPEGLRALAEREYCVQHQESDLDFVRRLLEEEGIPFRFDHHPAEGESWVLLDETPAWQQVPLMRGDHVPVTDSWLHVAETESIARFDLRRRVRPTGTTLRDFDFTRPRATVVDLTRGYPGHRAPRERYEYPARLSIHSYDDETHTYAEHDGARQARIRDEAERVDERTARGGGNVTGFAPGRRFKLQGHQRSEADIEWLITAVEHVGQSWSTMPAEVRDSPKLREALRDAGVTLPDEGHTVSDRYRNRFECIPITQPWRPRRTIPRPIVQGLQTARVVGPRGEDIHTDVHGRIKVQFHWDRVGQHNEHSSVWIRVSQTWSGGGWGFVFIPRIDMEVLVAFLEGDPDRPMVVGCVYNGENQTPYELPATKTQSTLKTWSTPTTGGYNELRFQDLAGEEQVYMQAERNMDTLVKNDQTLHVQRNRTKYIEGRERNTIDKDRATTVHGNEWKEVDGNQDVQVHGASGATLQVDQNYHVTADASLVLECGDSKITMTPSTIDVYSRRIRVHGEKLVEIIGELVKINCPDGSHETATGGQRRRDRFDLLRTQMAASLEGTLASLPRDSRRSLKRALREAMRTALRDVQRVPSSPLDAIASTTPLSRAMAMLDEGIARIASLPGVQGNASLEAMLGPARLRLANALTQGAQLVASLQQTLSTNEAWIDVQRTRPKVASEVLRRAAAPLLREAMMQISVARGTGRPGMQVFDALGALRPALLATLTMQGAA